jgi:hypothetical protein
LLLRLTNNFFLLYDTARYNLIKKGESMISMFLGKAHFISFYTCGILCTVYFITNVTCSYFWYKKSMRILYAALYGMLLSIPFMPFIAHLNPNISFSQWVITIFMFSNLIWQIIFLMYSRKEKFEALIIPLSLSNITAWATMSFVNYFWYSAIAQFISSLSA